MTNSQSSSSCTPDRIGGRATFLAMPLALLRRFAAWQRRRRAAAELARLAACGDHLLRDIGLDASMVRNKPAAALEHLLRRR